MLNIKTEMQDYIRRQITLNAEKDIMVIDGRNRTEIYSIGDDGNLYLCYGVNGKGAEFSRKLVRHNVKEFAATNIAKTNKVAVVCCDEENVYFIQTESPEQIEESGFVRLTFDAFLNGKHLVPSDLLLSALDSGVTLFVEMKDDSGRIEQFSCLLNGENPIKIQYFPLAANFSSIKCCAAGRAVNQYVDGVYTFGTYGNLNQLLYTPSCNVFGSTPPAPIRLKSDYALETICALPLTSKTGTHLLGVGNGGLYLYPFEKQKDVNRIDNPDPIFMTSSELFVDAKKIATVRFGNEVYVYVLNEANVLSFTFAECIADSLSPFEEPVVLMEDVFYFDVSDQGTMCVCKNNSVLWGKRDADSGEWDFKSATLETELDEYCRNSAYVTRIVLEKPFDEVLIEFQKGKACCYVNDVCHDFQSMCVKADSMGAVTISQIATSLTPPCFNVSYKGETFKVNPAEFFQKRLLSLTDENTLKKQVIYDPDGKTRNLIDEGIDETGLSLVASSISALSGSVCSIVPEFVPVPLKFATGVMVKITDSLVKILPYDVTHNPFMDFVGKVVKDVSYAVSWVADQVKWLYDHTVKKAVDFAIGLVGKVWKFVVKIGEKVLEVVVDTFEKVFSTAIKILEAIGIPISKIFDWLKKALGIDEACKMNDCLKKTMKLSSKMLAEKTIEMKDSVIDVLDSVVDVIADLADVDVNEAKSLLSEKTRFDLASLGIDCGPQGSYMFNTIVGVITPNDLKLPNFIPTQKMTDSMNAFEAALDGLGSDVTKAACVLVSIGQDFVDIVKSGNIAEVCDSLKRITGKLGIAGVDLCKAIVKPLFDMIACTIEALVDLLCEPIHIPLLSEILKIFGIEEFSIVDVFTFPASFLATNVSRIVQGSPLIDDAMYNSIMNADSLDDLMKRMQEKKVVLKRSSKKSDALLKSNSVTESLCPESYRKTAYTIRFILASLGMCDLAVDSISKVAALDKSKTAEKIVAPITTAMCVLNFGFSFVAGQLYSPLDSDEDNDYTKKLVAVKSYISWYTVFWYIKSIFDLSEGCFALLCVASPMRNPSSVHAMTSKACFVGHGAFCAVGLVFEILAAVEACKIDPNDAKIVYNDASRDRDVMLLDDSAYIIDDIKSIMDVAWNLGLSTPLIESGYGAAAFLAVRDFLVLGCYIGFMTASGYKLKN